MSKLIQNLKKFKLITFDVTETLLHFRRPPSEEYALVAAEYGYGNLDVKSLQSAFRSNFKKLDAAHPNFGYKTGLGWEKWWRQFIGNCYRSAGLHLSENELQTIGDDIIDRYETADYWKKVHSADAFIERLKNEKKIVGIISNFDPRLKHVLKNCQFPDFNFVIASYEVGATKPNVQIFDLAVKLGSDFDQWLLPKHCLHIGNTPKLDYVAATEAGWSSALIANASDQWKEFEQIKPSHVFNSLNDFTEKLDTQDIEW